MKPGQARSIVDRSHINLELKWNPIHPTPPLISPPFIHPSIAPSSLQQQHPPNPSPAPCACALRAPPVPGPPEVRGAQGHSSHVLPQRAHAQREAACKQGDGATGSGAQVPEELEKQPHMVWGLRKEVTPGRRPPRCLDAASRAWLVKALSDGCRNLRVPLRGNGVNWVS